MRLMTLVDALWPAPVPAPMSRLQCAWTEAANTVEEARGALQLRLAAEALGQQLRDLLPLCRCLPGISRIRPLPGGLSGVGDCGLIEGPDGPGLLRVRAWRPTGRLWLSVDRPGTRLQVDLRWQSLAEGSQLTVELQRVGGGPPLPRLLDAFAAQLALWLESATD
jgi:hypothetical protein